MSIQKFRSAKDMPRPPVQSDIPLDIRIAAAWERAQVSERLALPKGVERFRTMEEAQASRAAHSQKRA